MPYATPFHVSVMQNMLELKVQKSPVSVGLAADDVAVQCWAAITAMATNAASSATEMRPLGELTLVIEIPSFLVEPGATSLTKVGLNVNPWMLVVVGRSVRRVWLGRLHRRPGERERAWLRLRAGAPVRLGL